MYEHGIPHVWCPIEAMPSRVTSRIVAYNLQNGGKSSSGPIGRNSTYMFFHNLSMYQINDFSYQIALDRLKTNFVWNIHSINTEFCRPLTAISDKIIVPYGAWPTNKYGYHGYIYRMNFIYQWCVPCLILLSGISPCCDELARTSYNAVISNLPPGIAPGLDGSCVLEPPVPSSVWGHWNAAVSVVGTTPRPDGRLRSFVEICVRRP